MVEELHVTPEQFNAIETAWGICSFCNGRKAQEEWAHAFRQCVAEVIGREPPDAFRLVQVEPLPLLDPAEELAAAKADPNGRELSPAAQALYEAEGAARFAEHHGGRNRPREWADVSGVGVTPHQTFSQKTPTEDKSR